MLPALLALNFAGCMTALGDADLSDPGIKARLEAQLKEHKELDLRTVTIDVHSRIVTLSGIVSSYKDKTTLNKIVNSIPGVEQAVLNVVVQE